MKRNLKINHEIHWPMAVKHTYLKAYILACSIKRVRLLLGSWKNKCDVAVILSAKRLYIKRHMSLLIKYGSQGSFFYKHVSRVVNFCIHRKQNIACLKLPNSGSGVLKLWAFKYGDKAGFLYIPNFMILQLCF